jgi:peptidyl-dipeptidase Dcp
MKLTPIVSMFLALPVIFACACSQETPNPFFAKYGTPFETPPFPLIANAHFLPAYRKGMEMEKAEIDAITRNPSPATFQNTIEAFDRAGELLARVGGVFLALQAANSSDEIQKVANEVTPLLAKHRDDIYLNNELFRRVKAVHDMRAQTLLTTEQRKLLEDVYTDFVRGGANLPADRKARFRAINEELSMLALKFDENVLDESNTFKLVIRTKDELAGLPQTVIDAAAEAAVKAGMPGAWVFTTKKPSMIPFLQYAHDRALREQLFTAYIKRGENGDAHDNKANASRIAALRVERSNLLGYKTFADFSLERTMAKTPQAVYAFLNKLWQPALANAIQEADEMQKLKDTDLQPWDWWYYAEIIRKQKYDLDDNDLRPYFVMENVRQGAFDLATKLYGVKFVQRNDVPKYSDEVSVFEVTESNGAHIGILYLDYFPRPGKQSGAWCDAFRVQERHGDTMITPVVYNVGNFSRPAGDKPSLLSLDEVQTLFHEFGHALQALFSNVTYRKLSLPGDFVELPSQVMENWAFTPELLRGYARHYKTGEVIPQTLIDRIRKSNKFNQGFETVEYLAAAFLDMDWHMLTDTKPVEPAAFEAASMARIGLIPQIVSRYRTTNFLHSFSGGYAAGYYYYIWAAVLDADAFQAFVEKGLFDRATAQAFREHVLARCTADDAMKQYVKFRGKEPSIEPLLKRRGLMEEGRNE